MVHQSGKRSAAYTPFDKTVILQSARYIIVSPFPIFSFPFRVFAYNSIETKFSDTLTGICAYVHLYRYKLITCLLWSIKVILDDKAKGPVSQQTSYSNIMRTSLVKEPIKGTHYTCNLYEIILVGRYIRAILYFSWTTAHVTSYLTAKTTWQPLALGYCISFSSANNNTCYEPYLSGQQNMGQGEATLPYIS